jgi:ribulose-bisphosphate carboxylase small chain
MSAIQQTAHASTEPLDGELVKNLGHCLRKGCVLCIEHAEQPRPRYTRWEMWGAPLCYVDSLQPVADEIKACREAHADHDIRLQVEGNMGQVRMVFMVHRPGDAKRRLRGV